MVYKTATPNQFPLPISPPPAILAHNYAVECTDIKASHDVILQINVTFASIDAEVIRLSAVKESFQGILPQHKAVISPLRRVPNVIIVEIMKQCIHGEGGNICVFILAGLCSRWREIATSTSPLWTTIQFTKSIFDLSMTELILSRSCNRNLHVQTSYSFSCTESAVWPEAIWRHCDRFVDLDVCGRFASLILTGQYLSSDR